MVREIFQKRNRYDAFTNSPRPSFLIRPLCRRFPSTSFPRGQQHIFQIAVVADVKRGAGMHQVGDKKVGIEIPGGLQICESRVGQTPRCIPQ